MARKQTRGSISLSAATHEAIVAAAQREGVAASELVTRMVRAACPDLPKQLHQSSAEDRRASAAMTRGVPRERRTINRMSAKDVERALAPEPRADALARNPHLAPIPPRATCAHCGERDATVRDPEAPYCVSCAMCASDARPSGRVVERGY